ncbi:MAG: hypothetical protein KF788_12560 [Piscinibacter sp.]|nr:hypothetical protein [Piscinibacter sp.]
MSTPPAPRWKRTLDQAWRLTRPSLGLQPPDPADELESLRALCHELVADLPESQRHVIGVVLLHARGRQDILHLRTQLFDAISHQFGERVARERLKRLDAALL